MQPVSKHNIGPSTEKYNFYFFITLKAIKLEESICDSVVQYTLRSTFIKFNLLDNLISLQHSDIN